MADKKSEKTDIGPAERRWACVGPYYAMFPIEQVKNVIREHTRPGDAVLDPFAGRFSVPAIASYLDRPGCGVEISPLGWLYGRVKLGPAQRCADVLRRLQEMRDAADGYKNEAKNMGEFFRMCYCAEVRRFLLACRDLLDWKHSVVDATLMASVMVVLHHGIRRGLSNQMRQAKAMAPHYSMRWWRKNGFEKPPKIDPVEFLSGRISRRYEKGAFRYGKSKALLGDSCSVLNSSTATRWGEQHGGIKLLFTSPPYWSLVNYFKDQWLRLWLLGGIPSPAARAHPFEKGFAAKEEYRRLITTVFARCAKMMRDDGVIVVRMDSRRFTRDTILKALKESFPNHRKAGKLAVTKGKSQTALFNDIPENIGERDIVLVSG